MTAAAATARTPNRAPHIGLVALEARAPWEHAAALAAWPLLGHAPRGDGHPVLVLPGLGAGDATTVLLRRYLARQGFAPQPWMLGLNFGPRDGLLQALRERIAALHREHDRTVSLVGWSLGGVYARELAKLERAHVRCAVSLGSGFTGDLRATHARGFYEFVSGERIGDHALSGQLGVNPPLPTTSIYSRTDGVVAWPCSVLDEGPLAENIEVQSSHTGMGAHPAVLYALADRLAQPEGGWQPFDKSGWRRLVYA
ncbi:MAG: alpha/beta hydrolase [Proteobacteria bacterium]|nr:alpha/beta hydrolase [Pseudomonadota bacterium]